MKYNEHALHLWGMGMRYGLKHGKNWLEEDKEIKKIQDKSCLPKDHSAKPTPPSTSRLIPEK
mgnify:CR=1 FL=1